jgi:hypothetical protein
MIDHNRLAESARKLHQNQFNGWRALDAEQFNGRESETATFIQRSFVTPKFAQRFCPASSQPLGVSLVSLNAVKMLFDKARLM